MRGFFFIATSFLILSAQASTEVKNYFRPCHIMEGDVLTTELTVSEPNQGSEHAPWTITYTAYEDDNCKFPYLIYQEQNKAKLAGNNLDLEITETSYVPMTAEVAMALNMIRYCGYSDWAVKQKKVVSGYICDEYKAPNVGDISYTIFKTEVRNEKELLFVGLPTEEASGTSPSKRHRSLQRLPFYLIK